MMSRKIWSYLSNVLPLPIASYRELLDPGIYYSFMGEKVRPYSFIYSYFLHQFMHFFLGFYSF